MAENPITSLLDNFDTEDTNGGKIIPFVKPEIEVTSIVPDFAITLNEARERIAMLQQFVKEMMVENVDYGLIPSCGKPSLYKSGAEKLCDIFGFSKIFEVVNRVEDWKEGLFHYEVKAILISKRSGHIEAEGVGCCNNREKKYVTQHSYTIVNTILKMSKKRALIDAVLSATRSSGIFTQDVEDLDLTNGIEAPKVKPATKNQLNKIMQLVQEKNLSIEDVKATILKRYSVVESKLLSTTQADDFIKILLKERI